jgi:hypothetical protein
LRSVLKPILNMLETVLIGMPESQGRNAAIKDKLRVSIAEIKLMASQIPIFYGGRIAFQGLMLMPLSTSYSIYILPILFSVISLLCTVVMIKIFRESLTSRASLHSELSSYASYEGSRVSRQVGGSPSKASSIRDKSVNVNVRREDGAFSIGAASVGAASAKVAPQSSAASSVSS